MFHRDYKSFTEEKFLNDVDKEMIKGTFYQTNELFNKQRVEERMINQSGIKRRYR